MQNIMTWLLYFDIICATAYFGCKIIRFTRSFVATCKWHRRMKKITKKQKN